MFGLTSCFETKKINISLLGGPPSGSAQNARLVNCVILTALTRFHGDLAQEVNWAGLPRIHAWSIVCSSLPSQDVALPPNLPFWGELFLRSYFPTGHCWATPADPRPGGSSSFIEECPHPASTDLPARKRSKVGKMECEGMRKWKMLHPHQIKIATPTPSPSTDPIQWKEKLTEEKKEEKQGWKATRWNMILYTRSMRPHQPMHNESTNTLCTALKEDRKKENWDPKVEFWWCKRAAKFEGNRPFSLIDDYVSHLPHPKLMHQK